MCVCVYIYIYIYIYLTLLDCKDIYFCDCVNYNYIYYCKLSNNDWSGVVWENFSDDWGNIKRLLV